LSRKRPSGRLNLIEILRTTSSPDRFIVPVSFWLQRDKFPKRSASSSLDFFIYHRADAA
jgi:hypothetical protein